MNEKKLNERLEAIECQLDKIIDILQGKDDPTTQGGPPQGPTGPPPGPK